MEKLEERVQGRESIEKGKAEDSERERDWGYSEYIIYYKSIKYHKSLVQNA